MPIPGHVLTSSDNFTGGASHTRFQGPLLTGTLESTKGPRNMPGGLITVQCAQAGSTSVTNQALTNLLTTVSSDLARAAFIYIPQTTGPVSTTTFAAAEGGPAYTGCGAVLVWDAGSSKLMVYSTASGAGVWMTASVVTTGASATAQPIVFTSSA